MMTSESLIADYQARIKELGQALVESQARQVLGWDKVHDLQARIDAAEMLLRVQMKKKFYGLTSTPNAIECQLVKILTSDEPQGKDNTP